MDRRPARQPHHQAVDATNQQKHHGGDRIGLHQGLGRKVDLEPGIGTCSELFGHLLTPPLLAYHNLASQLATSRQPHPLFDDVNLADHHVMTDAAVLIADHAVFPDCVRGKRHHVFVLGNHLDVDVGGL